jgi:hypothetical protein
MQEHIGKIRAFLDEKKHDKFTGGIKLVLNEGNPVHLSISDAPDFSIPPVDEVFDLDQKLAVVTDPGFSGSLFLMMERGDITKCGFHQTIQGRQLAEFLGGRRPSGPQKRPVIAVRGRG